MNFKKNVFSYSLLIICFVFFSVKIVSVALTQELFFDGAQTAQISRNLLRGNGYSTSYNELIPFDSKISNGVTIVLPASFFFFLFGVSFEAALLTNAIYLILLASAIVVLIVFELKLHPLLAASFLILFLGTPKMMEFGFGMFGEGPMIFYLFGATIFLHKFSDNPKVRYLRFCGIFLGLAFLTKAIALIALPSLFLACLFIVLIHTEQKSKLIENTKKFIRVVFNFIVSFITPILVFEIYKVISLGLKHYFQNLRKVWEFFFHHPGVSQTTSTYVELIERLSARLTSLSNYLDVTELLLVWVVIFLIVFVVMIFWRSFISKNLHKEDSEFVKQVPTILFIFLVTLSFIGWWLLLAGLGWERYIFPGITFLHLSFTLIVGIGFRLIFSSLVDQGKFKHLIPLKIIVLVVLTLFLLSELQIINSENFKISFTDTEQKIGNQKAGDFIRHLPKDAKVLGYGWWEAPVVSFAADRQFFNIYTQSQLFTPSKLNNVYFVYDFYASNLDPGGDLKILNQFKTESVYIDDRNQIFIYKLLERPLFAYPEFSQEEKISVRYSKIDFQDENPDVITRNVYDQGQNENGRWAQPTSAYLLLYSGESNLHMEMWFQDLKKYSVDPVKLDIFINKKPISEIIIEKDGSNNFDILLEDIPNGLIELTIVSNANFLYDQPDRILSFAFLKVELNH